MGYEALAELIVSNKYSEEDMTRFRKIINNFHELYYNNSVQTWKNTKWRGVPVFKAPTDMWVYQELIHEIRSDVIIETGTCFGGSALYMADVLRACRLDGSIVVTIDIDHSNVSEKIKDDKNIFLVEGSSVDEKIFEQVKFFVSNYFGGNEKPKVMVILDSDHSKDHVVKELELYAPLVTPGSILIVEDTNVNGHPVLKEHGPGPLEAIEEWWVDHPEFEINKMCEKFMLTFNRGGYLERKKEG